MPTTYNGVEQATAGRPAFTISEPAGTDIRNSASVRTPFEKIADWVQTLVQKAGLLNVASTWTAKQTMGAALDVSVGDLELTNAAAQAVLKAGGGKMQVGTKTGNASDLELVVGGVVKATVRASDGKLVIAAGIDGIPMVRAWGRVGSDGTLAAGSGLTSVRNALGDYSITLSPVAPSATYAILLSTSGAGFVYPGPSTDATFHVFTTDAANAAADMSFHCALIW